MSAILCLNVGSSSIKFGLYRRDAAGEPVHRAGGAIAGIGVTPKMQARSDDGTAAVERHWDDGAGLSHEHLLGELLGWISDHFDGELAAIGHRVVHGGAVFDAACVVNDEVLRQLAELCPLAPLHQPHNLAAIRAAAALAPGVVQVACFDTAFHRTQPAVATRLALPDRITAAGLRRYGFHGISYEYIARRLARIDPALAAGRVIVAHLGNGASMCAMRAGASIDTTMGLTPLDGLVMGTRCGTLDPGAVLYLFQHLNMSAAAVEQLLYRESGLLAASAQISSDMRVLLGSAEPRAREAVDLFVYHVAREAGALASSLGGIDGFVFTAGIGENAPEIRARVCARLGWLGIEHDPSRDVPGAAVISTPASRVTVRVVPTDEERMIAIHAGELLAGGASSTLRPGGGTQPASRPTE